MRAARDFTYGEQIPRRAKSMESLDLDRRLLGECWDTCKDEWHWETVRYWERKLSEAIEQAMDVPADVARTQLRMFRDRGKP